MKMSTSEILYEDDHIQLLFRPGSTAFRLATFSNYGFAGQGKYFWGSSLSNAEDIETYGFVAKSNNWFPRVSILNLLKTCVLRPGKPILTYGHSQGGYAALKYSGALNASGVIACAPQFSIDPRVTLDDRRFTHHFVRDLHQDMEIHAEDVSGNLLIVFDPYEPDDAFHYRKIIDACIGQNFLLLPIYNIGHQIMDVMRNRAIALNVFEVALTENGLSNAFVLAKTTKKKSYSYSSFVAERLLRTGKPKLALGVLDTVIGNNNSYIDPVSMPWQALVHSKANKALGMLGMAIADAERALSGRPQDPRFLSWLAECLAADGQTQRAIDAYQRAIMVLPRGSLVQNEMMDAMKRIMPVAVTATCLDAARVALSARDWENAERLWQEIINRSPMSEEAWFSAGTALRELRRFGDAETLLSQAQERFPNHAHIAEARGWNAVGARDWHEAELLWKAFIARFPEKAEGVIGLSLVFRQAGRIDELEALVTDALTRFPERREIAADYAGVAALRRQWQAAADRFSILRRKFAKDKGIALGLADALRELRRYDEAAEVLHEMSALFPEAHDVMMSHAWLAVHQCHWALALCLFEDVLKKFPNHPAAYMGMSLALNASGQSAEREKLLNEALTRFPGNAGIAIEHGWISIDRRDWKLARVTWADLAAKHPGNTRITSDYGFVLLSSGDAEAAENLLRSAGEHFPQNIGLRINLARAAAARADWPLAVDRWEALHRAYPENRGITEGLSLARYALGQEMAFEESPRSGPAALPNRADAGTDDGIDDVDLVMGFESLGENCEFGLFQRAVGAEPIGLLRFAGITPLALAEALRFRFEGVGSVEFTVLRDAGKEYMTGDKRFGMTSHTFIEPASASFDVTYEKILRKLKFLKRKLVEDLQDGEKIFVYKVRGSLADSHLTALEEGLALYGKPMLLLVRLAEAGKSAGTVEMTGPGRLVGYVGRHGDEAGGNWNIPISDWLLLCRQARRLLAFEGLRNAAGTARHL